MDVLHDTSWRQWIKIAGTYRVPKYVTDHSPMDKEAAAKLDAALFADPVNMQFPVDCAASTWLSAAYFNENRSQFDRELADHIEGNIKLAAGIYNIDKDVKDVLEYRKAEIDPATIPSNYGYIDKRGQKYYPMFDIEGVKRAADNFERFRHKLPAHIKKAVAVAMVKKAQELDVALHTCVFREAGIGLPNKPDLMDNLLDRAYITKDAECAAVIASLVGVVAHSPAEELMENLDKLAHVVTELDKANGMDAKYGKSILPPADFIYSMMPKDAADFVKDALVLHRHTFSIRKLAEVDPDVFRAALGDDMFKAIATDRGALDPVKMAEILPTLPSPDKLALEEHIIASCE